VINRAQFKFIEKFMKTLALAGVIDNQDEATDYYCRERKRIMRRQRASRKSRRGWA
jgi:hypothetical protein